MKWKNKRISLKNVSNNPDINKKDTKKTFYFLYKNKTHRFICGSFIDTVNT